MMRVIIVDDEDLSLKRLKRILTESGKIEVCEVFQDPEKACEYAANNSFDAAFLDITMPRISGMQLIGELRRHHASLPIVLVTGYEEYAVQAFEKEVIDYVIKPVTAERVSRSIQRLQERLRDTIILSEPVSPPPRLTVRLFGEFMVFAGEDTGSPIKLRTPKTEELLAFLLYAKSTSRDALADTLWKDLSPQKAWTNINSTLYYVRRAIGDNTDIPIILKDRNGIRVDRSVMDCDLYEFETLCRKIRQTSTYQPEMFERIDTLYRGELLKGRHYEWALAWSRQLEMDFITTMETAAQYHLQQNQPLRALHYFDRVLQIDSIREDIHREVILLYLSLGRRAEAQWQYQLLEELLHEELGSHPSPDLKQLLRQS
ncbi:response regulator [Paenibacillus sp. FSL R7-0652]|jgi:two-component SAPR family response regulator|uniref:Response regulator n=1 Tax=Paenibacillus sp. AN1007 TaxID=3151385 RepID=A0AAU8NBG4_9BACL